MEPTVGISGWKYDGWKGEFYPEDLPSKKELEYASRELPTIEINSTFYSLQKPSSFRKWYDSTPDGFIFSVKANRYITHIRRLKEIDIPLANFFASGILSLKEKLGPILWQFPPSMKFDPDLFENFFHKLPKDFIEAQAIGRNSPFPKERKYLNVKKNFKLRHAVEVRNMSFLNPWFVEILRKYNIAIVFADTAGRWPYLEDLTADFIYIRLHGDAELYSSGYDERTLSFWAKRIKTWEEGKSPMDQQSITDTNSERSHRDIYVYFDNDAKVRAPIDAKSLIKKLSLLH